MYNRRNIIPELSEWDDLDIIIQIESHRAQVAQDSLEPPVDPEELEFRNQIKEELKALHRELETREIPYA